MTSTRKPLNGHAVQHTKAPVVQPVKLTSFDLAIQMLDEAQDMPSFFDETKEVQRKVREAQQVLLKGVVPK